MEANRPGGRSRRQDGMTIAELLISMTVLATVIGWVMVAFTNQHHNQLNHERAIEAQHEGRLITDLMVSDLRMAGFMVPTTAGLSSIDGGANASDQVCMSDAAVMDPVRVSNANQRFIGAVPTGSVDPGDGTVVVSNAAADIDGDGDVDFVENAGILIADADSVHCAKISDVDVAATNTTITFSPDTPAGFAATLPLAVVVPGVFYEVNGTELRRNDTVLSGNVEDVQIEFWVDTNDDGAIDAGEFPIHDLSGTDIGRLKLARVSVTSRPDAQDLDMPGQGFTAVANRVAGPVDDFKRRRQIAETLLRNMEN